MIPVQLHTFNTFIPVQLCPSSRLSERQTERHLPERFSQPSGRHFRGAHVQQPLPGQRIPPNIIPQYLPRSISHRFSSAKHTHHLAAKPSSADAASASLHCLHTSSSTCSQASSRLNSPSISEARSLSAASKVSLISQYYTARGRCSPPPRS